MKNEISLPTVIEITVTENKRSGCKQEGFLDEHVKLVRSSDEIMQATTLNVVDPVSFIYREIHLYSRY